MVWTYCTFLGQPKCPPPAIHCICNRTQNMAVSTTILFWRDWPTVVTWRFENEIGREKCKGKEEERQGSWNISKDNSEGGRQKGREGGRWKSREERAVVYSKDYAVLNPPSGPWHSSRGTLRCRPNILMHERLIFLEVNVAQYPSLHSGLRLLTLNQPPEGETHGSPSATSYSERPVINNRHWLYNPPARLGKWPRLHCNVCRPHDKEWTLPSLPKNNWYSSLCTHIH